MSFADSKLGKASTNKKPFFNGGSAADWLIIRPKIQMEFKIKSCFSLIERAPPILQVQAHGYMGPDVWLAAAIVEDLFLEVKPDTSPHAVDQIIQDSVDARQALHVQEMARLTGLLPPVLTANDQAYRLSAETAKLATDLLKIHENRPLIEARLIASLQRYETLKTRSETRFANGLETYTTCFGREPLGVIRQELACGELRAAWNKIDDTYGVNVDGHAHMSILLNVLGNITFQPEKKSLHEHIEDMKILADQVTEFGGGGAVQIGEALLLTYLCDSIKRSTHKEHKEDVKWIENGSETLAEAERRFQRTSSKLKLKATESQHLSGTSHRSEKANVSLTNKEKKRLREEYTNELRNMSISESANTANPAKKPASKDKIMCDKCKRLGYHTTQSCWVGKYICDKCGRAHPTDRCKSTGAVSGEKAEVETKKVSLVSMYKKK